MSFTNKFGRAALGAGIAVLLIAGTAATPAGAHPHFVETEGDPAVVAVDAAADGAWVVDAAGVVTTRGEAEHLGDLASIELDEPIVDLIATPTGAGYVMVAADGGVFAFGDAEFHGSAADLDLAAPIVGLAPTEGGYWLAAADGGVFAYGDAGFHGSAGAIDLDADIVAFDATTAGYRLVAADGGVFAFGDAAFHGSLAGGLGEDDHVVAIASTDDGYWIATADGDLDGFGAVADTRVDLESDDGLLELVDVAHRGDGVFDVLGDVAGPSLEGFHPGFTTPEAERYVSQLSAERLAVWEALAFCESTGRWDINTGNGYYGGIQFSPQSWWAVGGQDYPHQSSQIEQIYRGELLLELQGWGAWPGCTRKLGLR